jgi:hypothetical protein
MKTTIEFMGRSKRTIRIRKSNRKASRELYIYPNGETEVYFYKVAKKLK